MLNPVDLARADLNLLVLFEAVLAELHVGKAAEKLHLTPSAVSHGLGRLRQLLNDPLFLKTPKGVVPTERALELSAHIADILARVRSVVSVAGPFDAATSTRRFTIGAPDGVSAVLLHPLLAELRPQAPGVDVSVRQLLPVREETSPERAWRGALEDLESRAIDIAVVPFEEIPARFEKRLIYNEDFVIVTRKGHPFAADPTLRRYCESQHIIVSHGGDSHGFVDDHLAKQGHSRRVALTVPNFMFALTVIAETDLISALPRRFADLYAARFDLATTPLPLQMPSFRLNAVVPKAALTDAGVAWILDLIESCNFSSQGLANNTPSRKKGPSARSKLTRRARRR
ncbi:MAG TPA: LysR family transcriptional regulator [Steroidobacter sp.]|uniref:LysR family transcriptional regulator n=1 Tax=Steroidobacter sp. TaxID=1978227 RepID=UPI002ED9563D